MNKEKKQNFLDFVPKRKIERFSVDEKGIVILEIENKGVFNFLAQKLFKKPRISYIHLDEMGSFVWPLIDGEKSVEQIGVKVEAHFGKKANPLYERLSKYFEILRNYKFIEFE